MKEITPLEKAVNALESAHHELAQAKVSRARAADTLDRAKADYDKATDKEYACQSSLDATRENLHKLLRLALEQAIAP